MEGHDACRKIAILTSLVDGAMLDFEEISTEGISKIDAVDVKYAKALGKNIKLLAMSKKAGDGYYALVAPFFLGSDHPLAGVNGVFNAIFVHGNMLGDAMFYGSGAGKLPTASAVVADVVELAKNLHNHIPVCWEDKPVKLLPKDDMVFARFLRVKASADKQKILDMFADARIVELADAAGEFGVVTGPMMEKALEEKIAQSQDVIKAIRIV